MLSALDFLLEQPLDEIAANLPLSEELHAAAFGGASPVAEIVQDATAYQLGLPGPRTNNMVARESLAAAFGRAFTWAMESATIPTAD